MIRHWQYKSKTELSKAGRVSKTLLDFQLPKGSKVRKGLKDIRILPEIQGGYPEVVVQELQQHLMHVARIFVPFFRPPIVQDLASIKSSLGSTRTHRQTKNPIIIQDSTKQTPSRDEKLVPVYPSVPKPLLCLTCCSACLTYKRASPAQGWSAVPKSKWCKYTMRC